MEKLDRYEKKEFRLSGRLEAFGVEDFFNMQIHSEQDERNDITRDIIGEGHVFSLLSLTATSFIDPSLRRHWDGLNTKLAEGAPFHLRPSLKRRSIPASVPTMNRAD